jgi:hypothetical protein
MYESAEVLHHVPGRMRLRIAAAKGSRSKLLAVQELLEALEGVIAIETNPMLGTVLIRYDPTLFADFTTRLADYAKQRNLFTIASQPRSKGACVSDTDRSINHFFNTVNRGVQDAMGNFINLKEILPVAVGLYGLLFEDRAATTAQWLNWIQFAIDIYMDLHEQQPLAEVSQMMQALFTDLMTQHAQSSEALRSELTALRADVQMLANSIGQR